MRSRYSSLLFFLVFVMFFALPLEASDHNFIGKVGCFECHEKLPLKGEVQKLRPHIEKICMKCHSFESRLSHPVGIMPKLAVPVDMPLDREGKVSCITCHDVHMSAINKLTGTKTSYLRRTTKGKRFCYSCHPKIPV